MIKWLMKLIAPLIKLIGKIHAPWSHKQITGKHYYQMRQSLMPGCLILTNTYGELSNLINIGDWNHTAMYIGGGDVKYIVDATGGGTQIRDLVSFLTALDEFCVLKAKKIPGQKLSIIIDSIKSKVGSKYDYNFGTGNDKYYCSELVYDCINGVCPEIDLSFTKIGDNKVIQPDHFYNDSNNWEVVYDSRK